ncbi:protein FAR-RED-ELONGATED HYPOCOTYL 1-LIKE [Sesamum indicum]|uniref:Protein FAR-RED-ELONGATED HYPOCOTYL 1-LIKE n=1 Tax=Sesamum indicum TaxID=4182 RepID=A0A8M8V4H0_SESIN|nr:protein FAR-RED-ELONGATED HYPOCOTYL 1-LIKE [Sesamum indicum]
MEENTITPAEMNSIAYLNKKRKLHVELLGGPSPKHLCWGKKFEYESSSDSGTEPKKVRSIILARGGESDPESAKDSCSFHGDVDSIMSPCDDAKTYLSYSETRVSVQPCTSSARWGGTSFQSGLYSLESRSGTKSSSCKSESLSICEELEYLHNDYATLPSDYYEDHLIEFGSHADCSCSEYQNDGTEHHCNKDLGDLLYSSGVAPSNYVLSSGRWSVTHDTQPATRKLTIDKEFEQYFSSLML